MSERDPFDLVDVDASIQDVVKQSRKRINALARKNVRANQLEQLAPDGGAMGSTDFGGALMDADGVHTSADLVDINWFLPLNLSDDSVTAIYVTAYDGVEWVYVGGNFSRIGGVEASNIARYSLITRQWEEVNGGLNGVVRSIALRPSDGVLFVGGLFTDYLVYDNSGTWGVVVASLSAGVYSLHFDTNDDLYVGGDFLNVSGSANADKIFMWDGAVNALGSGLSDTVYSINISSSGDVWAGGLITNRIQKWNGASWSQPFTISTGAVYSIEFDSTGLMYVGGNFTSVNSDAALAYLFSYDGSTATVVGETQSNEVFNIQVDSEDVVYIGGGVLEKWDGTTWTPLSNAGGVSGLDGDVFSILLLDSGSIIIGGSFNFAGSIQCQSIALFCKPLSEAIDVIASLFELYANRTDIAHDSATITNLTATNATITTATVTNLTASTLNGKNIWQSKYKPTDESRSSTTTLVNDTDLVHNFGSDLGKYAGRWRVFFDTAAIPDFKFRLGGSATITNARFFIKYVVPGTTALVTAVETAVPFATTYAPAGGGTTGGYIEIDGKFEVTVTGTIALQWAQNSSNASATKTLSGSYQELLKVG